jgi:hypothetical protein
MTRPTSGVAQRRHIITAADYPEESRTIIPPSRNSISSPPCPLYPVDVIAAPFRFHDHVVIPPLEQMQGRLGPPGLSPLLYMDRAMTHEQEVYVNSALLSTPNRLNP